ncbi:Metallo-hydrolase/oxidoreductase [Macrolepiota fuliginosa MF-IS2]|uniref:Metallo-hydrolase/oxidoreductase n=1 Tax=Macrolepiota fuliginosa MF-IS2 TaxID=1400762 RepID=A0A9P5XPT6_9AGAR|nr:Metallo-hydrolase/oxidoreductase [Macrolepiota fuliginosa MF-IS2]
MALPAPAENQPYCTVSALEAGFIYLNHAMFIDNATSNEGHRTPSLSFLLQHSKNNKKWVFDLGIRKDWKNSPPSVVKWIENVYPSDVPQDVVDSLAKGGMSPLDIDVVCLSHCHWDHTGYTPPFAKSEFIVGGETSQLFEGGFWPQNPESFFPADLLPTERTKFLGENTNWEPVGPFPRAYNYYGDGSLYIIDAPGHLFGHINLLARTSADGAWIYLAGDTAHHWNLITGESVIACGHPGHLHGTAHQNKELAEEMIRRVGELRKLPRVKVIIAHDKPWYDENKAGRAFFPGHIDSL